MEAHAAVSAIQFAQQLGLYNVEIEGDSLGIIRKLQGMEEDFSPIETLIEKAKIRVRDFHYCKFMRGMTIWLLISLQSLD